MRDDLRAPKIRDVSGVCSIAAAIVGSAVVGAGAAVYGANKQAGAAKAGANYQKDMYDTTRGDLMPYNVGGQQAFGEANKLLFGAPSEILGNLRALPGYQFAEQQGLRSIQNSASARGLGLSGAAMREGARYATGLADQTYGNQVNRLFDASRIGANAAAQTGQAGTAAGQQVGNSLIQQGNAYAGGGAGLANNFQTGALGYGMYGGFGGGAGGGVGPTNGYDPSILEGLF